MHAVCETQAFHRAADSVGMSEAEIVELIDYLAANPMAGDVMAETGGCRKLRVAARGRGKSGGYRTITFYTGEMMPVFLITVFGKGEKANLNKAERNKLRTLTKQISDEYQRKVAKVAAKKGA